MCIASCSFRVSSSWWWRNRAPFCWWSFSGTKSGSSACWYPIASWVCRVHSLCAVSRLLYCRIRFSNDQYRITSYRGYICLRSISLYVVRAMTICAMMSGESRISVVYMIDSFDVRFYDCRKETDGGGQLHPLGYRIFHLLPRLLPKLFFCLRVKRIPIGSS